MQGIKGNDFGLTDEEYRDEFIRVYEGYKGIKVPQEIKDSEVAFSDWLEGLKKEGGLTGASFNQMMVKCHLAVAYHGQSKDDVEAEHMHNRDILIEKGLHTPVD